MSHAEFVVGLDASHLSAFLASVLTEDMGIDGDVTSAVTVPADALLRAEIATREAVVPAGIALAEAFFRQLDPNVRVERLVEDGEYLDAGSPLMRLEGAARALLTAERSALNSLQHLSGIATLTRSYAEAISGTGCRLLDTRKTIPGLRNVEKYAARVGGATNCSPSAPMAQI